LKRSELAHILRAASRIAGETDIVVFGSQSILGSFDEDDLPDAAVGSVEADVTFWSDARDEKADMVDGAIGEGSEFHQMYGYYAQGVSITTAKLPADWKDRVVVFQNFSSVPGRGICLEPHDLVVSKLVAGREKDLVFAAALLDAGLIQASTLMERARMLDELPGVIRRIVKWIEWWESRFQSRP
jgi:hypothetical protein